MLPVFTFIPVGTTISFLHRFGLLLDEKFFWRNRNLPNDSATDAVKISLVALVAKIALIALVAFYFIY
jgi:hypothetical protein